MVVDSVVANFCAGIFKNWGSSDAVVAALDVAGGRTPVAGIGILVVAPPIFVVEAVAANFVAEIVLVRISVPALLAYFNITVVVATIAVD